MKRRDFFKAIGATAAAIAFGRLPMPPASPQLGVSARMMKMMADLNDQQLSPPITRMDILYGYGSMRPQMACNFAEGTYYVEDLTRLENGVT